jgi:hypothetical protein
MIPEILQKGGRGRIPFFLQQDGESEPPTRRRSKLYFRVGIRQRQPVKAQESPSLSFTSKGFPERLTCPYDR